MITLHNVSKTFFSGLSSEIHAVRNISLNLKEGEWAILAGSNGSGKSTLLNIISGTVTPDSGKVYFNQKDITYLAEHKRATYISRIFQNPLAGTASQLTVAENFRLAALRSQNRKLNIGLTKSFQEEIVGRMATLQLGIENKINTPMGQLSGGQRQALTLLMASMSGAKIMLMDEPSAALDPKTGSLVLELADRIVRESKMTAVLVTHHIKDMLHYGNRLLFMNEGEIVKDISAKEKQKLMATDVLEWLEG